MKVLFIGNSYTYGNNLPKMVQELATKAGKSIETEMVVEGGKSLEWHCYNLNTANAIKKGDWDFIIMQDQSTHGIEAPEKLLNSAKTLVSRIKSVCSAQPMLYLTWARKYSPETQDTITQSYMNAGKELNVDVAAVGVAWQMALKESPELSLYKKDESHPNILGSYIAACLFYGTLFKESPIGLSNEIALSDGVTAVIDKDKALLLQQVCNRMLSQQK